MNDPMLTPSPPTNIQAELAKERNRAAAERTLMAWIRTCLALISFGFGIDSVVGVVSSTQVSEAWQGIRLSRIVGLAFIALGIYAMLAAVIEHHQELSHIQREAEYRYRSRASLGLRVAISLIGIGLFTFVWLVVDTLRR